jgi:hypothetical protein
LVSDLGAKKASSILLLILVSVSVIPLIAASNAEPQTGDVSGTSTFPISSSVAPEIWVVTTITTERLQTIHQR